MSSQVTVKRPRVDVSAPGRRRGLSREWKVLLLSSLAVFMVFLDVTIVNIAFPAIRRTFTGTSLPDLSWVLNGYNVVVAALLVPAGRLADRLGRRRVFFVGLALFLLGSVISGSASSAAMLIAARLVQALGGAALIPASLGLVLEEFPAEKRAMATSVWAAAGAVAAAAGPSLGGVLVETTSWRWAFFVNLAIAIGMLRAPRLLRETRESDSNGTPDLLGATMLVVAVGALALGIVKAPDWGWTSDRVLAAWSIAVAFAAIFVARSARHPAPVIEPAMLRIRTFSTANAAFFLFSIGFYALLLGNILFLTQVWRYSLAEAGFAVTPAALMAAIAAAAGGRLVERFGSRQVAVPGLMLFCGACLAYHGAGARPNYLGHWLPAQLVSGSAVGLTFAGLTSASVADLPLSRLATGTAVSSCFRQIGAVIGIAGLVAVLGTPDQRTPLLAFEHAWTLMACTALGAALLASLLPARRRADESELGPRRRARRAAELRGVARNEIRLHGHRLVYRVAGTGPALLLIHGLFEDALTWRRVIPRLARTHTVIAPDLLGTASPTLLGALTTTRRAATRERFETCSMYWTRRRDGRRPLTRRRHRVVVRVQLSRASTPNGADLERRARARGPPATPRAVPTGSKPRAPAPDDGTDARPSGRVGSSRQEGARAHGRPESVGGATYAHKGGRPRTTNRAAQNHPSRDRVPRAARVRA